MPELPEMENYKSILSERIVGKRIYAVTVTREKAINIPVENFMKGKESRVSIVVQ